MKGGITSGIVYPPAVGALSKKYRFRQIGGTSAGAIAAGCTAAAEYGSASTRPGSGFEGLGQISDWLGTGDRLLGLFEPAPATRPLLKTLLAMAPRSRSDRKRGFAAMAFGTAGRLVKALVHHAPQAFFAGAAIGAFVCWVLRALTLIGTDAGAIWPRGGWPLLWAAVGLIVCALIGGLIAGILSLARILVVKVPANFYGICTGHVDRPQQQQPVLTDWLYDRLQALAGLEPGEPPLTFGMLKARGISLLTVTSNLSHGQPYTIPFEKKWLFNADEMAALLPAVVVKHLVDKSYESERISPSAPFYFLPPAEDFPVLLAMRMSLSFPLLISAVPLYLPKWKALRGNKGERKAVGLGELDRNWFSDGGISSNFPIHFFDAWLPRCPTFGINLRSMPPGLAQEHVQSLQEPSDDSTAAGNPAGSGSTASGRVRAYVADEGRVFLPTASAPQYPEWTSLGKLTDFLSAIWNTAQNFRDSTQSMLPSYRERIVNVRFSDKEGGLNLTMEAEKVKAIQERGAAAGQLLVEKFDFAAHRWVRLLVLMPELEMQVKKLKDLLESEDYAKLLTEAFPAEGSPYPRDPAWRADAGLRLKALVELIEKWKGLDVEWLKTHDTPIEEVFFPHECPKPTSALRVTPRV